MGPSRGPLKRALGESFPHITASKWERNAPNALLDLFLKDLRTKMFLNLNYVIPSQLKFLTAFL